ncbi:hypothetical protein Daesc_001211 [Daldinia eschscholtzii]|uniref:Rhodopsin domain-containing protein n=1 Tax=Daldinia eschscholtzii TaxID=292717 RepID=A0AAX6N1U2_9PEZI
MAANLTQEDILDLPAEAPPPGVVPNFENPSRILSNAEAALHGLYALSTVMFFIKMYTQLRISRKVEREDYVLILTWLLYTGAFEPVGTLLVRTPYGAHQWEITLRVFSRYLFIQYCEMVIWVIAMLLVKITILLQYLRIFTTPGVRDFTFWASHALLYLNIAYYIAFTFIQMFPCNPRQMFWDKTITDGHCMDIFAANVSGAVVCLVSDLAILVLPQRILFKLNVRTSRKIGLCILFAIGIFACTTSTVRLYYNIRLWQTQTDISHQLGNISIWGTAQLPTGFLIICLPSVPKLLNHLRSKPWAVRLETSLRSLSRQSTKKAPQMRTNILTIGGGGNNNLKQTVVSDVEFRELMATNTDLGSLTSFADSHRG